MLSYGKLPVGLEQRGAIRGKELVLSTATPPSRRELHLARNSSLLCGRVSGRRNCEKEGQKKLRHWKQSVVLSQSSRRTFGLIRQNNTYFCRPAANTTMASAN